MTDGTHWRYEAPVNAAVLPPARRGRRRLRTIAAATLVAALAALAAYLGAVNSQWVAQNEELRGEATVLGSELAQARADADAAQAELDEATARIRSLVNDEAQAGDQALMLGDIGARLVECAAARAEHIGYLNNAARYTAASLAANEAAINAFCSSVTAAYRDAVADS